MLLIFDSKIVCKLTRHDLLMLFYSLHSHSFHNEERHVLSISSTDVMPFCNWVLSEFLVLVIRNTHQSALRDFFPKEYYLVFNKSFRVSLSMTLDYRFYLLLSPCSKAWCLRFGLVLFHLEVVLLLVLQYFVMIRLLFIPFYWNNVCTKHIVLATFFE